MTRFKLLAAALGLVLATGTIAEAKTVPAKTYHVHAAKSVSTKIAYKTHRAHIAHLRALHKKHLARHVIGHRVVKAHVAPNHAAANHGVLKTTKTAGTTKQPIRHAMNHRGTVKPVSVIR